MMMNTINHNHHHHHHHHQHSSHNGSSSNFPDKMQRTQDYVEALEEERKKILVFQRELPLCLELVTQAIETCKHQLCGTISECNFHGGQSECSEQTSTEGPVLEEFIPLKRTSFSDDEDEQEHSRKSKRSNSNVSKKSDWLRSVQLWNQTPDPPKTSEISPKRVAVTEVKRNSGGGAFHPFMREKSIAGEDKTAAAKPETPPKNNCGGDRTTLGQVAEASSTADTGGSTGGGNGNGNGNGKKEEKDGQSSSSQRKSRRCWSPELHKRFLSSLHQLGGAHVATPKQIRELMKVDGLTNDEVKSHLQKYRLHTRRPSPTVHNNINNPQAPQFVVVGGIWVPPPEYAAMAAATGEACGGGGSSNGIYAPIAALPPPFQDPSPRGKERKSGNDECGSHSGGGGGGGASHSPTSSAATDTTTTSPHY